MLIFFYNMFLSFVQGVRNLKGTDLNAVYVLIKPPSIEVLEQRLRDRNTETEESLKRRLSIAKEELDYGKWKLLILAFVVSLLLFGQNM